MRSDKRDILDAFLGEMEKSDNSFTIDEIYQNFVTLGFVGNDAVALTAVYTLYLGTIYPEKFKKLEEEIRSHYKHPSEVEISNLNQLEYLSAFINESMRFMPALPQLTSRFVKADTDYGGISMKKDWLAVSYLKAP